jgi:hypothetical protein
MKFAIDKFNSATRKAGIIVYTLANLKWWIFSFIDFSNKVTEIADTVMLSILGSIIATTMIIQIIEGFQDSDIWNKSVKNSIKNLQVFTLCALPSYAIAGDILGVVLNYDVDVTNVILSSVAFLIIVGVSIISLILLRIDYRGVI